MKGTVTRGSAFFAAKNWFFTESWGKSSLGGASADARSYWQGRFAACALVGCSFGMVARKTVGALPQTPQGTLSLDPARGNFPLDPFRAIELVTLSYFFRVLLRPFSPPFLSSQLLFYLISAKIKPGFTFHPEKELSS